MIGLEDADFLVPLLITALVLALHTIPSQAALLRDIRVGEYDGFTRIVFEFNVQAEIQYRIDMEEGKMHILFSDMRPDFTRRITTEPKERIADIHILQQNNTVSIKFTFKFSKIRFESFQLKSPPRLVVDVYHASLQTETSNTSAPELPKIAPDAEAASIPRSSQPEPNQSPKPVDRPLNSERIGPASSYAIQGLSSAPPSAAPTYNPLAPPTSTDENTPSQDSASHGDQPVFSSPGLDREPTPTMKNGLPYYLLLALVILTIAILSLLIIMLFSKHKWTGVKKNVNLDDLLHRQDEYIASINSQIEEQLKRYDEI